MAVPLPENLEKGIGDLLQRVSKGRGIHWVGPDQMHVTLRFIGDTDESLVPRIENKLGTVSQTFPPFRVEFGGLNAFPNLNHPKVIFLSVLNGIAEFQELEKRITFHLNALGIKPDEKEYHAHLTLGRVRDELAGKESVKALQDICPTQWVNWAAERFVLFQSRLTSDGPIYKKINIFELGKS